MATRRGRQEHRKEHVRAAIKRAENALVLLEMKLTFVIVAPELKQLLKMRLAEDRAFVGSKSAQAKRLLAVRAAEALLERGKKQGKKNGKRRQGGNGEQMT